MRILTYHRITDPEATPDLDPGLVSATPEVFRSQMEHLRRWYRPVATTDVLEAALNGRRLPRRAVHVTFDDGYRDFAEVAWPILRELGIPVTLFIPTAYPDNPGKHFWWDRLHRARRRLESEAWRESVYAAAEKHGAPALWLDPGRADVRTVLRELPHDEAEDLVDRACVEAGLDPRDDGLGSPVLGWEELRELGRQGVRFGAHTHNHVALSHVEASRMRIEIRRSLRDVKRELGAEHAMLSYPYGVANAGVMEVAAAEGCVVGFTCEDGFNRPGNIGPLRLRRTNITRRTSAGLFRVRMHPWFAVVDRWRHRSERARLMA